MLHINTATEIQECYDALCLYQLRTAILVKVLTRVSIRITIMLRYYN